MVHCFDENVKILGPKSFEVEKHNKNEETKMSFIREKRRAGCTVKTIVSDDEPDDVHMPRTRHHHHRHHPIPKNFNTKTSYSVTKSVTSPPVEHNFNTRHSSSSDTDISSHEMADHHDGYKSAEQLPSIPHLPEIPHIGHEATYPNANGAADLPEGNGNGHETVFEGEDPGPGEKTISFKTNTHRHEVVDQTGFVREKTNGYPVRPNDDWRARFKDMPYLVDENGKVISNGGDSSFKISFFYRKFLVAFLLHFWISVYLIS